MSKYVVTLRFTYVVRGKADSPEEALESVLERDIDTDPEFLFLDEDSMQVDEEMA